MTRIYARDKDFILGEFSGVHDAGGSLTCFSQKPVDTTGAAPQRNRVAQDESLPSVAVAA